MYGTGIGHKHLSRIKSSNLVGFVVQKLFELDQKLAELDQKLAELDKKMAELDQNWSRVKGDMSFI